MSPITAKTFTLLSVSFLAATCVRAQLAQAGDNAVHLEKVSVTETPIASQPSVDSFSDSCVKIDEGQLRDLNALDFTSALRRTPGVTSTHFNQVGAFGGAEGGAIFLRGMGSSRPGGEIKTLVNGVPKMNGIFNHPLLDLMSIDAASHIDVSTRATPTSFGNAFAVVNVTTPRLERDGELIQGQLAGGSSGTYVERFDYGRKEGPSDTYFSQSYRHSDGQRPDSDGSLENYFLHMGWALSKTWDLSYELNHTHNLATDPGSELLSGSPSSTKGETYETADWLHIASLSHRHGNASGTLHAYVNDGEGNWTRRQYSGNSDSLNDWRLYGLRWRETLQPWDGGELLFGTDLDCDRGKTSSITQTGAVSSYGPATTRILSPYAGINHSFDLGEGVKLTPSAGLRSYQHSTLDSKLTPQAGLLLTAGSTQVHASFCTAANYPGFEVMAFSNLIIPALGQSWKSLNPEEADQYELGVHHSFGKQSSLSLTLFRNEISNRYVIVFPPPVPPRYANIESYRSEGIELTGETSFGKNLAIFGSISLMNTTPGDIPYNPHGTYTTGVNWQLGEGWKLSFDGSYVSSMHVASQARSAGALNTVSVSAHFLLNARLSKTIEIRSHKLEFFVSGENLTDRDFAYTPGYPIPGVNCMFGTTLRW